MARRKPEFKWNETHLQILGVKKFDLALNKAFNKYMSPLLESRKEEMSAAFVNRILNLQGPTTIKTDQSPERRRLAEISIKAFEIFNTYEFLLDTEIYIRKFPYPKTRIGKTRYTKTVFGNYLNNIYMLRVRMDILLDILRKRYGKKFPESKRTQAVLKTIEKLDKFIKIHFDDIQKTRGTHVHIEEFYDTDLDRLLYIEIFIHNNPGFPHLPYFETYFEAEFKKVRKEKIKEIKEFNEETAKVLDKYFEHIYHIVFDHDDELITSY